MLRCSSRSTRRVLSPNGLFMTPPKVFERKCFSRSDIRELFSCPFDGYLTFVENISHTHGDVSDHPSLSSVINFISRPPFGLFFGKIGKGFCMMYCRSAQKQFICGFRAIIYIGAQVLAVSAISLKLKLLRWIVMNETLDIAWLYFSLKFINLPSRKVNYWLDFRPTPLTSSDYLCLGRYWECLNTEAEEENK